MAILVTEVPPKVIKKQEVDATDVKDEDTAAKKVEKLEVDATDIKDKQSPAKELEKQKVDATDVKDDEQTVNNFGMALWRRKKSDEVGNMQEAEKKSQ